VTHRSKAIPGEEGSSPVRDEPGEAHPWGPIETADAEIEFPGYVINEAWAWPREDAPAAYACCQPGPWTRCALSMADPILGS